MGLIKGERTLNLNLIYNATPIITVYGYFFRIKAVSLVILKSVLNSNNCLAYFVFILTKMLVANFTDSCSTLIVLDIFFCQMLLNPWCNKCFCFSLVQWLIFKIFLESSKTKNVASFITTWTLCQFYKFSGFVKLVKLFSGFCFKCS